MLHPAQQPHQRGFAGAVAAQDADAVAGVDHGRGVAQHPAAPLAAQLVELRDVVQQDHRPRAPAAGGRRAARQAPAGSGRRRRRRHSRCRSSSAADGRRTPRAPFRGCWPAGSTAAPPARRPAWSAARTARPTAAGTGRAAAGSASALLRGVIANLIENVRQHAGAGAACSIGIDSRDAALHLLVSDDGAGISDGNAPRIFDRFFTTTREAGGTGLGLPLVRGSLEAFGGGIALLCAKPATFRLTLPIARA
ncbi:ATP-binding protein [Leptolyngbya sp. 15MV]|nr:ATP-binding protein [Leptolyngbya sp. 15MV]